MSQIFAEGGAASSTELGLPPASQRLTWRQMDRLPTVVFQIVDEFNRVVDLTLYTVWIRTVRIDPAGPAEDALTQRQVQILDAVNGICYYDVQEVDTTVTIGLFELIVSVKLKADDSLVGELPTERDVTLAVRSSVPTDDIRP